jgi:hypothetical protein
MPAHASHSGNRTLMTDPVFRAALSGAAGAVAVSDETANAVLELSDADLGRALKEQITRFRNPVDQKALHSPKAALGDTDPTSVKVVPPTLPSKSRASGRLNMEALHAQALQERERMVAEKRLLDTSQMVKATGLTRQSLTKAVRTGRMFTVKVVSTPYYPAFYAHSQIDARILGKATRKLGDLPGWLKLDFFEAPNAALGNVSPLDALLGGRVEEVICLAEAYGDEAKDRAQAAADARNEGLNV